VEPARQKLIARIALGGFAALCIGWLARLDYSQKVSTNVLDLLPSAEQSPDASIVRSLADDAQVRVMLFSIDDPAAPGIAPAAAARQFAAELRRSPEFAESVPVDGTAESALGQAIFERRLTLLFPTWLGRQESEFARSGFPAKGFSAWLAERSAARLEAFLAEPQAVPMEDIVTADPLLLVPGFAEAARNLAPPSEAASGHALVWARIRASPLAAAGQGPVFAAIDKAFAPVKAVHPEVELRWSGVNRFAAASRARIQTEMGLLNALSILAVLGVGCVFVRHSRKMLHLAPVIAISLLGAWTVTTLVFSRVHILAFVIGSLLSGIAIDYGFYIFMQPALSPGESYAGKLRRLLKPLLASCLTTVIGFSLLLFSDLPLLREVGLFVATGLLCALGAAILYFAQLDRPFLESRPWAGSGAARRKPRLASLRILPFLAAAAGAAGLCRLHWRDDVREMEISSPELDANDSSLRAMFGDTPDRQVYLTHGATVSEARRHLDDFVAYEAKTAPGTDVASLGLAFPTEANWRAMPLRLAGLGGFSADFRAALVRHGFTEAPFSSFFAAWEDFRAHPPTNDYESLYTDLSGQLAGPFALLYRAQGPMCWFLTIVGQGGGQHPPAELNTIGIDQLESLNNLFVRYRWSALRLSLAGLALVIASVFVIYHGNRAVRIALIPSGSCFFVFGLFGLFGQTLNLFNLLGAFLGVCLAHNYAIFSSDSAASGAAPPPSIRLSALCAAASFGTLGFSRIPVIHALGVTVAMIVLSSLAVVELEPLARGGKR
jgi:predicted exporter